MDRATTLRNWEPHRKSRYKGAQATGIKGQWRAVIHDPRISGGRAYLGQFKDERLASAAYDAALWLLGEKPLSIQPWYFEQEHSPELQALIATIADRIGKPYPRKTRAL